MDYLPLFADLKDRPVLVVGGGEIAARKIKHLCLVGAKVYLVARDIGYEVKALLNLNNIKWINSTFDPKQLDNVFFVIAATQDNQLNSKIFQAANERYKFVNVVDDTSQCSVIFSSIVDRSPLIVAISSSGTSPVLSRLIREKIEALLPVNFGKVAEIASLWRKKVKDQYPNISDRRSFWENMFNGLFVNQIIYGNVKAAYSTLDSQLKNFCIPHGNITLVGAGPGDAGLITLHGLQAIQRADVILYDHLISNEVLNLTRCDAKRIYVGKRSGLHSITQKKINQLLIMLARQGKRVVRLKGGDPFIFGRGGEELEAAKIAGVPFQVVPGVTSAVGASAYAGIPLTHRHYSQSILFITGHSSKNKKNTNNIDWNSVARSRHTIVIYMGSVKAREIANTLIENGCKPTTAIAVIGRATYHDQRVIIGTLEQFDTLAIKVPMPTLFIIGEVVKLHNTLAWFKNEVPIETLNSLYFQYGLR